MVFYFSYFDGDAIKRFLFLFVLAAGPAASGHVRSTRTKEKVVIFCSFFLEREHVTAVLFCFDLFGLFVQWMYCRLPRITDRRRVANEGVAGAVFVLLKSRMVGGRHTHTPNSAGRGRTMSECVRGVQCWFH